MSQIPTKPDLGSPPSAPRWVKVFIVIFIVLVLIVVLVHLLGVRFDHGAGSALFDGLAHCPALIASAIQQL